MCFSVQVERNLEKIAMRFGAKVSNKDYEALANIQKKAAQWEPEKLKQTLGLKRKPSASLFKQADEKGRVYPGYFAPVIVLEDKQKVIKPMRYRVRPEGSAEEIPSKFNVFNARSDSLMIRKTWKGLFLRNHGLFPFIKFYEWVERDGKKVLINFSPENREIMWAPAIFDSWKSLDGEIEFNSFALITKDPPREVLAQGHDRCPVFMEEKNIDLWLQAKDLTENIALSLLDQVEPVIYNYSAPS